MSWGSARAGAVWGRVSVRISKDGAMQDAKRKFLDCTLAADRTVRGCRGFTLMELMVYIAIVGIVVIVAGQAFSNSTKMRVRTQSMLKASEVAENVAALFKQDVAQTGAKSSMESHATDGSNDTFSEVKPDVYIDPDNDTEANKDSSSFQFVPASPASNENLEQFKMRRVRYDSNGKYEAVEEISWILEDNVLKRRCVVVDGEAGTDCAPKGASGTDVEQFMVEMATDVDSFKVLPAIPWQKAGAAEGEDESLIFPDESGEFKLVQRYDALKKIQPLTVGEGGQSVILKNFASNYVDSDDPAATVEKNLNEVYAFKNTASDANWKSLCEDSPIHLATDTTYELSFKVYPTPGAEDAIKAFIPNKDHMAVGFRSTEGEKIAGLDDFAFYPPAEDDAKDIERKMRFSVKSPVDVCLAFTFSYYSPAAASAPVVISNVKLRVVESAVYKFDNSITSVATKHKKNVKAFLLRLKVKRNGESGETTLVIPTPSNGPTD